jgi:hypothetical protein
MTLEQLGNVGEFIAAIATLATLVYLALQIRQNTQSIEAQSHHAITDSFNDINSIIGTDPIAARIFRVGRTGLENLSEDDAFAFGFLMLSYMRIFETLFFQRENSVMSEQLYQSEQNSIRWAFASPGGLQWWRENTISFSPEFRTVVDGVIEEVSDRAAT